MQIRKEPLENNHFYHIYSRSIAGYKIFNEISDYERFFKLLNFYRYNGFEYKCSRFLELDSSLQDEILWPLVTQNDVLIRITAFCLMPTHIHLILEQTKDNGISKYMGRVLNGYSRYFNTKHHRLGPLWSGRFKNVLVDRDDQLLHLTRYIHLNPTSAGLVTDPEEWIFSSYNEYIHPLEYSNSLINKVDLFNFSSDQYKKFVLDQKNYQRELALIKSLLVDDYTG